MPLSCLPRFPLPQTSTADTPGQAGCKGLCQKAALSLPAWEAVTFPSKQKQNPTNSRKFQNHDGKTPEHRLGAEKHFSDRHWKLFGSDSQMLLSKNHYIFPFFFPQGEICDSNKATCGTRVLSAITAQKAG